MKIEEVWTSCPGHPVTDPFPPHGKTFLLRFVKGDFAWPYGWGQNWFKEPIFTHVIRFSTRIPLPHWAWQVGSYDGYLGLAKVWGMDEENPASGIYDQFRCWLKPEDVYPGSQAMMASARNGLTALPLLLAVGVAVWSFFG